MESRGQNKRYFMVIVLTLAFIVFMAVSASGSFFKNTYYPEPYSYRIDTFPVLKAYTAPGIIVTAWDEGADIVTLNGKTINVSLMETDPYQNWQLMDAKGAECISNDVFDSYPVRHVFRLKVNESSPILFRLYNDRESKPIKNFYFNLVVDEPLSGIGWPKFSGDTVPTFVWPPIQKF